MAARQRDGGRFRQAGALRAGRTWHSATKLADGRVLVLGGRGFRNKPDVSADIFDPVANAFVPGPPPPSPRQLHSATLLADGRVLIAGGKGPRDVTEVSAVVLDLETGEYVPTGAMRDARYAHTATLLPDGRVLVAGGYDSDEHTTRGTAEIWDPETGRFSAAGRLSSRRVYHLAHLARDGRVVMAGGMDMSGGGEYNPDPGPSEVEAWDPATETFAVIGRLQPPPWRYTITGLADDRILVVGGERYESTLREVRTWDPVTGASRELTPLPVSRKFHTATLLPDGRVLLAGGENSRGHTDSAEIWDPESEETIPTGDLIGPLRWHTATLLDDGRVLLVGGETPYGRRDAAEVWTGEIVTTPPVAVGEPAPDAMTAADPPPAKKRRGTRTAAAEVTVAGVAADAAPIDPVVVEAEIGEVETAGEPSIPEGAPGPVAAVATQPAKKRRVTRKAATEVVIAGVASDAAPSDPVVVETEVVAEVAVEPEAEPAVPEPDVAVAEVVAVPVDELDAPAEPDPVVAVAAIEVEDAGAEALVVADDDPVPPEVAAVPVADPEVTPAEETETAAILEAEAAPVVPEADEGIAEVFAEPDPAVVVTAEEPNVPADDHARDRSVEPVKAADLWPDRPDDIRPPWVSAAATATTDTPSTEPRTVPTTASPNPIPAGGPRPMPEPYTRKIQRAEPGLIVLVIDDSGSMADPIPGSSDARYLWVERYVGHILQELLARSTEMVGIDAVVKPRYYVKTILYGNEPVEWPARRPEILDIEEAVRSFAVGTGDARHTLGLGGKLGGTDADAALKVAERVLIDAVADPRFARSFPPLVFHLSDGMSATDASGTAERIRNLTTADGNVLLLNAFIGVRTSLPYQGPGDFPGYVTAAEAGPDPDSLRMFEMSSACPPSLRANLVDEGIFPALRPDARLYFDVRTREMLKQVIQSVGSVGSRAYR